MDRGSPSSASDRTVGSTLAAHPQVWETLIRVFFLRNGIMGLSLLSAETRGRG
ncbi:MAG: hypothetical protein Kow0092_29410 [Deferrisomatales bacterium]